MSSNDIKGKLRKILTKECPDCEETNLQLRDFAGHSITICPNCGYEEENEALNKNNIRKLREAKNGKVEEIEIRQKQTGTNNVSKSRYRKNI